MIQGNFRYRKYRRCSHGIWKVLRQWLLPSLSGILWFLVSSLHLSTHFWILSVEQLPLQGSWFLLLHIFDLWMASACHGTCSEAKTFLFQGPSPSNSLLACVCKFKSKNWISPAKIECLPWCHPLWHGWEEVTEHTGLPKLYEKGQSCWEWGL